MLENKDAQVNQVETFDRLHAGEIVYSFENPNFLTANAVWRVTIDKMKDIISCFTSRLQVVPDFNAAEAIIQSFWPHVDTLEITPDGRVTGDFKTTLRDFYELIQAKMEELRSSSDISSK